MEQVKVDDQLDVNGQTKDTIGAKETQSNNWVNRGKVMEREIDRVLFVCFFPELQPEIWLSLIVILLLLDEAKISLPHFSRKVFSSPAKGMKVNRLC